MNLIITESFSLNLRILRIICLYPSENPTRFYKVQSYVMYSLFVVVVPFLIFLHLKLEEDADTVQKSLNFAYMAEVWPFTAKLLPFIIKGHEVKMCINYFEAPFFAVHSNEQRAIIGDFIRNCQRNSRIFFFGVLGASVSWVIRPLLVEDCRYPVDIWLPFNTATKSKAYYSVYIFIAMAFSYAAASAMVDPLLGGLAYHAAGQFKVLKNNLQHLNEDAVYWKIKQCIKHHNAILNFVKEYERCFSWVLFTQLASSVLVICFLCQRLGTMQELNFTAVSYTVFIGVILGQIYFYCYYGSVMSEESHSLTTAIYMCNWYEYDLKSKKALIMLMERSQRPLIITAGRVLDLSLQTFTMILRRSYSLIAVLKNF